MRAGLRPVVLGEHTAHDILVDLDAEYKSELLGDPPAAESGFRRFISMMAAVSSGAGPFGPGLPRHFGENSSRYLRCTSVRWKPVIVEGLSTMAERSRRAGRIKPVQRPAMTRSIGRRFGALVRDRLRINS